MLTQSNALEAVLFAAEGPVEKKHLASLFGMSESELAHAITELTKQLDGRGLALIETVSEVELRTSPDAAPSVQKFRESELSRDLGKAGLETLAVIAYRSGATRSEIDWVRGVNSSTSLRTLLLRGLIEGREDPADRRRVCYTLTTEALAHLSITHTEDLPRYAELAPAAVMNDTTVSSSE